MLAYFFSTLIHMYAVCVSICVCIVQKSINLCRFEINACIHITQSDIRWNPSKNVRYWIHFGFYLLFRFMTIAIRNRFSQFSLNKHILAGRSLVCLCHLGPQYTECSHCVSNLFKWQSLSADIAHRFDATKFKLKWQQQQLRITPKTITKNRDPNEIVIELDFMIYLLSTAVFVHFSSTAHYHSTDWLNR